VYDIVFHIERKINYLFYFYFFILSVEPYCKRKMVPTAVLFQGKGITFCFLGGNFIDLPEES
jgi:hypothetical protein